MRMLVAIAVALVLAIPANAHGRPNSRCHARARAALALAAARSAIHVVEMPTAIEPSTVSIETLRIPDVPPVPTVKPKAAAVAIEDQRPPAPVQAPIVTYYAMPPAPIFEAAPIQYSQPVYSYPSAARFAGARRSGGNCGNGRCGG